MRFGVLGPLAVWTADSRPVTVPERKVRALLADLLVHQGRPVPAGRLADDLWGEDLPGNPANTLQTKVSQLRRALDAAEPGARELVAHQPPGYLLRAEPGVVDARRFQTLTAQARAIPDPAARAALLADALALWRGPAYADLAGEPFVQGEAARLEEQRLVALEEHAEARLALGDHHLLAAELGDLVARHPLRERLRAAHLRALYRAGRQTEALDSYRELRERLREELGLEPGPELVALQEAILRQDRTLDAPAPAPAPTRPAPTPASAPPQAAPPAAPAPVSPPAGPAPPRRRTNLPTQLTDLIGREDAVARVRELLEKGRLVTLTGSGGVGKTRLATAAAAQLADRFADGAWLVELASVSSPNDAEVVGAQALDALDIREDGAAASPTLVGRVAAALRTRQLLLVLDNCERLTEPVAELADRLLHSAPELRILVTSQEPLGLAGEVLWAVPPLECPAPDEDADVAAVQRCSAVRLFAARAAAAAPGFTLDATNAQAVATVCRRLDGIPLALELAANRVRTLGVHGLADRLDARLDVLTSGYRDAPPRQQTLRAAIDWSWEPLSEPERTALRRLAVHADGCALDAAEAVCAGGGLRPGDVLDLLAGLVDRCLVTVADSPGGPRYRLLQAVAEYCLERLGEAGETGDVSRRHRHHYAALAEQAEPQLRGAGQRRWLERLDRETANLRRALEGAVAGGDTEMALRLVNALAWYWFLRGRLTEARRSLDAALALDGPAPASARAQALTWQAGIALRAGQAADREARTRAALERHRETGDERAHARAAWFLGFARSDYDVDASEELVGQALAAFRTLGDAWGEAAALSTRAKHAFGRGDRAAARRDSGRSHTLFRDLGDRWGQLQATEWLGALAEAAGDHEQATRLHAHGLRMAEELGLWPQAADELTWLGKVALELGDHAQARELVERGRRLAREQGYQPGEAFAEITLGVAARRQGKLEVAEAHLRGVLETTWQHNRGPLHPTPHATILTELGRIAEARGDLAAARDLYQEGLAVTRTLGDPRAVALAEERVEAVASRLTPTGRPTEVPHRSDPSRGDVHRGASAAHGVG